MGTSRIVPIKPATGVFCKPGPGASRGWCKRGTSHAAAVTLLVLLLAACGAGLAAESEVWSSDNVELDAKASAQLNITFEQIPARSWTLVVDGGDRNCDLNIRRERDGSLLYQGLDERRHVVPIPWGQGEVISVVLTNRDLRAAFVVSVVGPPRDQLQASYSYHVNRALEKFASGQRLSAEDECRKALLQDPQDGVAKVLLAGFLRDRHYYDQASVMVEEALAGELPGTMRSVAESLRRDLVRLRAPLPLPVRRGVEEIEQKLLDGEGAAALAQADELLAADLEIDAAAQGRLQMLRGQALDQLGRNFEALEAFTVAQQLNRDKGVQAIISFHMGRLFLKMENLPQAEGAFTLALQDGLPSGLDVQAREHLQTIASRLRGER